MLTDKFSVTFARDKSEPNRDFLHDIEDRDEHELRQDHRESPLRAGLRGGDDAARICIGEHNHQSRTNNGKQNANFGQDFAAGQREADR